MTNKYDSTIFGRFGNAVQEGQKQTNVSIANAHVRFRRTLVRRALRDAVLGWGGCNGPARQCSWREMISDFYKFPRALIPLHARHFLMRKLHQETARSDSHVESSAVTQISQRPPRL